ncbi:threonine--tRNA ligase [Azospirillum halopraeferens]|uniref:threonine--tRNA ligase n=1 Tax=Azospirillum halopraeferens TaxID=34010 RepID=UPI0004120436|nr:threonine--tRNA ligase [Azospirillum halopraeferens]
MDHNDHRAIANRLDLFHQQEEGPGVVFWHPRGAILYRLIEADIRRRMRRAGFAEVITPQLLSRSLWERSGHWDKFGDAMFAFTDGERSLALKPMSCPGHIQIFNKRVRSFRDLPVRYCEFGVCHRYEPSGALQGLMRTRAFTQDDAHIFCAEEQVEEEVARFCRLLNATYADYGFDDVRVGFSTRPAVRAGSDALWDRAEAMLAAAAQAAGLDVRVQPGEGAFYGPKLEFVLRDRQGRDWQCGTIQLDMVLPERLDVAYTDAANRRVRPVMIHHAVLGSLERFIGMLLEHHNGRLPLWLAPDQVVVASVGEAQADYARTVVAALDDAGLRAVLDDRPERLSRKAAEAREAGIPVLLAVGAREAAAGTVALRRLPSDGAMVMPVAEAVERLRPEAVR